MCPELGGNWETELEVQVHRHGDIICRERRPAAASRAAAGREVRRTDSEPGLVAGPVLFWPTVTVVVYAIRKSFQELFWKL